jgi:4-hydroxybenzoyl-CoA thioesterase
MTEPRVFRTKLLVRFGDCDPAGIVFYPRYFEMFNNLVEDWCPLGLGASLPELIAVHGLGLPTVSVQTNFLAMSAVGDVLTAELSVSKLGGASITIAVRLFGADGALRVDATLVLVLMELKLARATRFPASMRSRIGRYCATV